MNSAISKAPQYPEQHVVSDIPALISSQQLTKPVIACQSSVRTSVSTTGSVTNGGTSFIFLSSCLFDELKYNNLFNLDSFSLRAKP